MKPYTTQKQMAAAQLFRQSRPKARNRNRAGNIIRDRWQAARRSYKKAARQAGKLDLVAWTGGGL